MGEGRGGGGGVGGVRVGMALEAASFLGDSLTGAALITMRRNPFRVLQGA